MVADPQPVEFEVPARVEYVGLLRMLVSSLAGDRRALDEDQLADLSLAVSEACNLLVDHGGSGNRLAVTCREEPDALILEVHGAGTGQGIDAGGRPGLPPPEQFGEDHRVGFELIRALIDEVGIVDDAGVEKLRMRIVCGEAQAPGLP
jgi:anti-sigma regulatory factor (Ser/Thr protein kinase)